MVFYGSELMHKAEMVCHDYTNIKIFFFTSIHFIFIHFVLNYRILFISNMSPHFYGVFGHIYFF